MRLIRSIAVGVVAACLGLWTTADSSALVVQGPMLADPTPNGVGWWRGASAVAIGPRHIISAKHLGGVPGEGFLIDGVAYPSVKITQHPTADFAIIELATDLPYWHDLGIRAKKGDQVWIGGLGQVAGVASGGGIQWSNGREERWGRNKLDKVKNGRFEIKFDKGNKALPNEAIFSMGDSGAGVFTQVNGSLQLVGIATNVQGSGVATYGQKGSGVDVTAYRGWISQIMQGG